MAGGKVQVMASGDADDIRAKYGAQKSESTVSMDGEEANNDVFDRM